MGGNDSSAAIVCTAPSAANHLAHDAQEVAAQNLLHTVVGLIADSRFVGIVLSACFRARRAGRRPITPGEEGVQLRDDRGSLPDGCPHSLHRAATHVANREDPVDPGLQR